MGSPADDAVELTRELVALDTVNPALVPGAPGERPAVELLAARLSARGFEIEIVGPADRPSLLATHKGLAGGRSLALNGHLDTVGVEGMDDPFTPRIDAGRMYGRGTCDMKAGVAAMVVAAEHAALTGHDGDILLALVADEEHGSLGTAAVLDHLAGRLPDACIVGEPTWLDVIVAHRGFAAIEVQIRGRAAHSSRPHDGVNAVTHLGRLLAAIEARDSELRARDPHPYTGHGSLMATVVSGGSAPFTLAASATAIVERRTVPGESRAAGLHEVQAIIDDARSRRRVPRAGGPRPLAAFGRPRRATAPRAVAIRRPRRGALLDGVRHVGGRGRADRRLRARRRRAAHHGRMG